MAARDILFIAILLFGFAIGFLMVHLVVTSVVDRMVAVPTINESSSALESIQMSKTLLGRLDYVVFGLFIGLVLSLIITGWFVGSNPLFMFVYFLVVVIGVVLSTVLANVWEDVSQMSTFGATVLSFPITNHLLLNLPMYVGVVGFIGIVVMFAKPYVANKGY